MLNKNKMIHYAHRALYGTQQLSNRRRRLSVEKVGRNEYKYLSMKYRNNYKL